MPRPTKIALFEDYLRHRIASAAPNWIPANVLLREIQQMGFAGSERTVRNLVSTLRPMTPPDPVVRFETEPGNQMHAD